MTTKINQKTPISYYGGKQSMLKHILPILPEHKVYVEAFFGGGAVFWAKEPVKAEVINDYNGFIVNFYQQLKTNFKELKTKVDSTPYSRDLYKEAMVIYNNPFLFNPLHKAWAFWILTVQGFSNQIGSWRSSTITHKESLLNHNKKILLTETLADRLDLVQIENKDAIKLIKSLDSQDTFFYCDPPYVNSNQGHYGGYTQQHFDELLETLSKIRGKFLLSSYPNDSLEEYRKKYGWFSSDKDMSLSVSPMGGKRKIEALTGNYILNTI